MLLEASSSEAASASGMMREPAGRCARRSPCLFECLAKGKIGVKARGDGDGAHFLLAVERGATAFSSTVEIAESGTIAHPRLDEDVFQVGRVIDGLRGRDQLDVDRAVIDEDRTDAARRAWTA